MASTGGGGGVVERLIGRCGGDVRVSIRCVCRPCQRYPDPVRGVYVCVMMMMFH